MRTVKPNDNSRLSLIRLSEVYGHLDNYIGRFVWNGLLHVHVHVAWSLLQKTHPEMQPLAIPYTGQLWLPHTKFFNTARYDVLGTDILHVR